MLKRYLCVIFTLLTCVLGFPSFSVSAEDVVLSNEEMCSRMYDKTISEFSLSGDTGESSVYFVYGVRCGSNIPVSSLVYNGSVYACEYNPGKDTYSTYTTTTFSLGDSFVRAGFDLYYYFNPSDFYDDTYDVIQFHYCYTDNVRITEYYPDDSRFKFYTFSTFEDISEGLKSQIGGSSGSTESTENSGFELPDSWLNGGETLPAVEDPTFPASFSPDEAFGYIEDYTVELDEGTKSGIGFFWAVLTGVIGALGIWDYVFFSLLMGLLVWVLRGVF